MDGIDGKNDLFERPVLIVRKFNNGTAWIIPITSKKHENLYFISIENGSSLNYVALSQVRTVSLKRFRRFIRKVSTYEFALIQGKVLDLFKYR